jgi:Holliday junction resolvase
MGPETKLYKKLRKFSKEISWIRIENLSSLGTPDLLGYNNSGTFFTVELKVTKGNKVKFSPHQIAFHKTHSKNTFILVEALGQRSSKLVQYFLIPGSRISELVACGLMPKLAACSLTLEACGLKFQNLN